MHLPMWSYNIFRLIVICNSLCLVLRKSFVIEKYNQKYGYVYLLNLNDVISVWN